MVKINDIAHLGGVVEPKKQLTQQDQRKDQRRIITWHHKAVKAQLKQIATEQDTTIQKLMAEAINKLFIKYKKGPIA
jgi:hypothetical protein